MVFSCIGENDIVLDSDWISATDSVFCGDDTDYWTPNEGKTASYPSVVV